MKFKKAVTAPAIAAALLLSNAGVASAATDVRFFNDLDSNQNTIEYPTAVGTHSVTATDCGGPVEIGIYEDVFGPDIFEGSNTAVCNSGIAATIFGTRDSRDSGDRGHYAKNQSSQRIDLSWERPT